MNTRVMSGIARAIQARADTGYAGTDNATTPSIGAISLIVERTVEALKNNIQQQARANNNLNPTRNPALGGIIDKIGG